MLIVNPAIPETQKIGIHCVPTLDQSNKLKTSTDHLFLLLVVYIRQQKTNAVLEFLKFVRNVHTGGGKTIQIMLKNGFETSARWVSKILHSEVSYTDPIEWINPAMLLH